MVILKLPIFPKNNLTDLNDFWLKITWFNRIDEFGSKDCMGGNNEIFNKILDNICSIFTGGSAGMECWRDNADITSAAAEKPPWTESSYV